MFFRPAASGKLGYHERRDLHALTADPAFYKQEPAAITRRMEELRALEVELAAAYERWEELEAREGTGVKAHPSPHRRGSLILGHTTVSTGLD